MPDKDLIEKIRQKARLEEERKKVEAIKKTAEVQKKAVYVPKSKGPISKAQILQKLSTISPEEQASREMFLSKIVKLRTIK